MKEDVSGIYDVDEVVDRLLRDRDYLLAKELKHKAEELNQLFIQAHRQKLKIEVETSELEVPAGGKVPWLKLRIFKEI